MRGVLELQQRQCGESLSTLSIATAMAIESYMATKDRWVDLLLINVRTVYRNLVGAVESTRQKNLIPADLAKVLVDELAFIAREVATATQNKTKVEFYYPSYSDLTRVLPHASLRQINTPLQIQQLGLEQSTFLELKKQKMEPWEKVSTIHPGRKVPTVIITHQPVDLLAWVKFPKLTLLESHTGVFKNRVDWHTKLGSGGSFDRIPFGKFALTVFGDKNNLLTAMPFKAKQLVFDMAEADRWTSMSTDERIKASLQKSRDHFARDTLMRVLRS